MIAASTLSSSPRIEITMISVSGKRSPFRGSVRCHGRRATQSFMAMCDGKYAGTIGNIGAFSFQQGKQMTTGEGGIVVTNDDDSPAECIFLSTKPGATVIRILIIILRRSITG